jgi:hypothetical protein
MAKPIKAGDSAPALRYQGYQSSFWDEAAIVRGGDGADQDVAPGIYTGVPVYSEGALPENVSPWDIIYLDGRRAPGIARVEGGRHLNIDIPKVIGQLIPEARLLNFDPVPFTVTLTIWHPDQFTDLRFLLARVLPPPGQNPVLRPVRVSHPALDLIGVTTIYVQGLELPRHLGKGIQEFTLQCYEWNPDIEVRVQDAATPLPDSTVPNQSVQAALVKPTPPSADPSRLGPNP